MTQCFPAYQLTCADLDRLKAAAARVFDRSVSPQSRLELIARSAGFGSYAALRSALAQGPARLTGDQEREEAFIVSAGLEEAPIAFVDGISHTDIIAAALAWPERLAVHAAMSMTPAEKLAAFKSCSGTRQDFLDFLYDLRRDGLPKRCLYRASISPAEAAAIFPDTALIIASPANQRSLSWDLDREQETLPEGGAWIGARVRLGQNDRFFEVPDRHLRLGDLSVGELACLIRHARVICFDEKDRDAFLAFLTARGLGAATPTIHAVKREALEIEDETDASFFEVGYYGTARMDLSDPRPCEHGPVLEDLAFHWICEIVNVVHGCDYEFRRMTIGQAGRRRQAWDHDLLIHL